MIRAFRRQPGGYLRIFDRETGRGLMQDESGDRVRTLGHVMKPELAGVGRGLRDEGSRWGTEERMPTMQELRPGEMAVELPAAPRPAERPPADLGRGGAVPAGPALTGRGVEPGDVPGAGVYRRAAGLEALDLDGVPAGAEMGRSLRRERPDGALETLTAKWTHGKGDAVGGRSPAAEIMGDLSEREVSRLSGLGLTEKSRREEWRREYRGRLAAREDRQALLGAEERKALGAVGAARAEAEGRGRAAEVAGTAAVGAARAEAEGRRGAAEAAGAAAVGAAEAEATGAVAAKRLEVDELRRQWDEKKGEKPRVERLETGDLVVVFNGQMLRVGERVAQGRVVYAEELDDQGRPRRRAVGVIGDDGKAVALQEKYEEGGIGLEGGRGGMSFRERLMRAREGKGR